MADHLRKRIRDRVTTVLTGLTTTAGRVFPSRAYPVDAAQLPGLLIYTLSESVEHRSYGEGFGSTDRRRQVRTLQLGVEAVATLAADLDDTLDQICKEVEVAMAADLTVSGLAHDVRLEGTEVTIVAGEGRKPAGAARMSWLVDYHTREGAPDTLD